MVWVGFGDRVKQRLALPVSKGRSHIREKFLGLMILPLMPKFGYRELEKL